MAKFGHHSNAHAWLPLAPHGAQDVTIEEIVAAFSKYGLIKEDDNRQPRIKLYRWVVWACMWAVMRECAQTNLGLLRQRTGSIPHQRLCNLIHQHRNKDSGALKGDGLVTYLKEPSVALAVQLLDGTPLRPGGSPNMTVSGRLQSSGRRTGGKAAP